jgi:hypothetical protein
MSSVQDFDPVISAFKIFDSNHSGIITEEELVHLVSRLPDIGTVRPAGHSHQMLCIQHVLCLNLSNNFWSMCDLRFNQFSGTSKKVRIQVSACPQAKGP